MKAINIKFGIILILGFLTAAPAQQLKPTEIIYSRLPSNINLPPTGSNSPTIWVVGQDGSNDRMITPGTAPRISDDGRFLLFKRFTRHPSFFYPFGGYADFFVRELATGQETLILAENFDQATTGHYFSPESNQGNYEIIFDDSCLMYKMNRSGSGIIYLYPTTFAAYCADDFPVLRRGGDQLIAFHNLSTDAVNGGGLFTVGINGSGRQKIPNTSCGDINPAWSNDSQFLAFGTLFQACSENFPQTAYPYFVKNLYKIRPDGTGRQQLTNFSAGDCRNAGTNCLTLGMVWTEDNSRLVTAGRVNGQAGLFAFNTDGNAGFARIPISAGNAPDFVGGIVQPRVDRNVVSIGGGVSSAAIYQLVSTIGEPVAGVTSTGDQYSFESGFWATVLDVRRSALFDFDGDGKSDLSVFRPSVGEWYYQQSSTNITRGFGFGTSTDKVATADFTGDGKTDIAFWRPSTGEWYVLRSEDSTYFAFPFGAGGDIPAPADYDGDGRADAAVFRPSISTWFILRSSGGVSSVPFGISSDVPVPADYDGDGKADVGIYRPGPGQWWNLRSSDNSVFAATFGSSTDKPVPGDYTGDGKADVAFWRPSNGNWFILRSEDQSFYAFPFGANGDKPAPGDFDGDGKFDATVFRPSDTNWYILKSTCGVQIQQFGAANDIPLPGALVP